MGVPIGDGSQDTIQRYAILFWDDQLFIIQEYEDMEFMVRNLLEEYEKLDLKINLEKTFLRGLWIRNQRFNIGRSEKLYQRMLRI